MKNRNKLLALALAGAMSLSLLAGCGGGTAPATPAPVETTPATTPVETTPATDGAFNLNVCIASEPQTIDPALNSAVDGGVMTQHFFEGLTKWADNGTLVEDATINYADLVPGQAESWDKVVNEDGTTVYTFHLRDDIKWSDGQDVTAGDFVYAWQRLVNLETAADYRNMASSIVGYNEITDGSATPDTLAVKAVDDKTLEVTLYTDLPYFLELCAFPALLPVREDTITANGDKWTFDPATYISNGAYKMQSWTHNQKIVMEKNEYYYDYDKLGPDTITFTLTDDDNAMLAGYRSDELQFIEEMPVDEVAGLLASDELKIIPYLGTYYVCYQNQKAPFDDWRVRKAFTLAINSQFIVDNVTQTGQIPANGWVPTGISDAEPGSDFRANGGAYWEAPTTSEIYQKNLEEANKLLDEAGYTDRSTFPPVEYLYNTSDNHRAIGEALQQQWEQGLGVKVTLKNQDWSVFLETRKQGDYQIARNGWINDYNDPMGFLDMWLTGGGNNDAQYSNANYDSLIQTALSTSDPAERMDAMHKAEDQIMGEDWALGPIYFYTQKYMMKDNIDGVFYTPLGFFFFMYATQA